MLRRGLDGGQAFVGLAPVAGVVARYLRHAHDGVDGGADVVGHLRQKRAFRLVGLLGNGQRLLQAFAVFSLLRAVEQHVHQLLCVAHLRAEQRLVVPAQLAGLLMASRAVAIAVVVAGKRVHVGLDQAYRPRLERAVDAAHVLGDVGGGDAQDALRVRADVVHRAVVGAEHDEDVVGAARQRAEQLLAVFHLPDLPIEHAAPVLHQDDHHERGKREQHHRHGGDGEQLHLRHAGVYHVARDHAHHHPVLEPDGHVVEVVLVVGGGELRGAASTCVDIGTDGVDPAVVAERGYLAEPVEQVGRLRVLVGGGEQQVAGGRDHEAAGLPIEGVHVKGRLHVVVVVAYGDGRVFEPVERGGRYRRGEHREPRAAGGDGVRHDAVAAVQLVELLA